MNNIIKSYWEPTPKFWRKIGDSLLAVAGVIAVGGLWQYDTLKEIFTPGQIRFMIASSIIVAVVGKFLTNFFKDPNSTSQNTTTDNKSA